MMKICNRFGVVFLILMFGGQIGCIDTRLAELADNELERFEKNFNPKKVNDYYNLPAPGEKTTLLIYASNWGRVRSVEFLLKNGADPMIVDHLGETCIHVAASLNDVEIGMEIVELVHKYDNRVVNIQNNQGENALHLACRWKQHKSIVEKLLKLGVDTRACDVNGRTPLEVAINNDIPDKSVIELLTNIKEEHERR